MSITRFNNNLSVISQLDDTPTLTPTELKAKFDEGGKVTQDYINNTLIPEIEEGLKTVGEDVPAVVDNLNSDDPKAALSAAQGRLLDQNKQKKILFGSDEPSGGEDGDIYIQY